MAYLTIFVFFKRLHSEFIYLIVSDNDMKNLQRLTRWIGKYTTCQISDELSYIVSILKQNIYNVSDSGIKFLKRARFQNKVYTK